MRNGINERIYIGLGFKLINFTSFGESLFSIGLFQKTTKRDLFVKGKFGIKIQHIREKTLENMRSGRQGAAKWGQQAVRPPLGDSSTSFWSILPPPPKMYLNRTSSRFDPRAHVGPPGLYKKTPAPLKASSHQVIWRSSHLKTETLIPQSSSSSRALAS
jgi:hypothetical protein